MKALRLAAMATVLAAGIGPVSAAPRKVFEEKDGVWAASCFRESDIDAPYCRVMAVQTFRDGAPWSLAAPRGDNHVIAPPDVANAIIAGMTAGSVVRLSFLPATGIRQDMEFSLAGFPALVDEVRPVLGGGGADTPAH